MVLEGKPGKDAKYLCACGADAALAKLDSSVQMSIIFQLFNFVALSYT